MTSWLRPPQGVELGEETTAVCRCHHETRTIAVSPQLVMLNDEAVVREGLLHEIAHAREPREM
jgi:hypothetical protein